ncbi:MAG: di-heme oxidoredictase family protein [Pseudomonadota bacterium]
MSVDGRFLIAAAIGVAVVLAALALRPIPWPAQGPAPGEADSGPLPWRTDLTPRDRERVRDLTAAPGAVAVAQPFEINSAGAATFTGSVSRNAFSNPSSNLSLEGLQAFALGNAIFRKLWVSSPSSTQASDGLGPIYNARSCQRCHLKDGRGHPPVDDQDDSTSLLLRVALTAETDDDVRARREGERLATPDPAYGGQIQDVAVAGVPAEGRVGLAYVEHEVQLSGGERVSLREPHFTLANPAYGPLHPSAVLSARVAQPMIGLGLLEAIHEGDLLDREDPQDADGDGISGRAQRVRDPESGEWRVGRFGWKAAAPSLRAQTGGAFLNDMGISSAVQPRASGECTLQQTACLAAPTGVQDAQGPFEATNEMLDLVVFYSANLAVPARRDVDDPQVLAGKGLFHEVGCAGCHRPNYVTRRDASRAAHQFQMIWPYTDLLLHDMGEGLSSETPVGQASGREWRTPPLWGIGLTEAVSGHTQLLHDGRARGLLEAILWHGGEASAARDRVMALAPSERRALLAFLRSL